MVGVALIEGVQGDGVVRGATHGLSQGERFVVDSGAQVRVLLPILVGGGKGDVAHENKGGSCDQGLHGGLQVLSGSSLGK